MCPNTMLNPPGTLNRGSSSAMTGHPIDTTICIAAKNSCEKSSLPSKNLPCISMDKLQIGALVLLGRLVEAFC